MATWLEQPIAIDVKINFRIRFWDAVKLRLAGKAAEQLIKDLAKRIADNDASPEMSTQQ